MPTFQAINLEPEENIDDEIDTTRQLDIDEALKRFQTALKLHAQGPRFFDEASDAYDDLFQSEIFRYPDAATEYERSELHPEKLAVEIPFAAGGDVQTNDTEGTGSTLPQALYLAHKNHGQFLLDRIRNRLRKSHATPPDLSRDDLVLKETRKALDDFNAALDRDPSDAELWRRTARVASFLQSTRLNRYCLEAAIELDDDPTIEEVAPPSLAEGLAGETLKEQLQVLSDDVALSHPIMGPWVTRRLPELIRRHIDPVPFLPNPSRTLKPSPTTLADQLQPRLGIACARAAWPELGLALLQVATDFGLTGQGILIELPDEEEDTDDDASRAAEAIAKQLAEESGGIGTTTASPAPMDVDLKPSEPATENPPPKTMDHAGRDGRQDSISTRKRSQSAAGLNETGDDENVGEKRSKRIRRRETAAEEAIDSNTVRVAQLAQYQAADQNLFQLTKDSIENLGVTDQDTLRRIGDILDSCASDDRPSKLTHGTTQDFRRTITSFDPDNAKILINKKEADTLGMSAFLEHAKGGSQQTTNVPQFNETQDAGSFARRVNAGWNATQEIVWQWIVAICPSYTSHKWSDVMKTTVVQVISKFDEAMFERVVYELDKVKCTTETASAVHPAALDGIVEMLFELHVDIYERITNPNSAVDYNTRVEAKGRLGRWLALAAEQSRNRQETKSELSARFLWAAIFSTTLTENASREFILQCWTSLRNFLAAEEIGTIRLHNNAVLSEISASAADGEISKLTTMDFFLGLFQDEISDPVTIIDNLEPVLNPDTVFVAEKDETACETPSRESTRTSDIPITDRASQGLKDLWKFVRGTSTELRLFLWTRLSDAYGQIKYSTKQFSCRLRAIEMIVADLDGEQYAKAPDNMRPALLLRMIKSLDDLLVQALSLALNDPSAFDIIDENHLRSSTSALAKISTILHVAAMIEDEIRIGITQAPSNSASFHAFMLKLREMQVRAWCLQYTMLKAGIHQNPTLFPKSENDLADYLAAIHGVLGPRKFCKVSNKIFLKMMRVELLKLKNIENWEDYLGQVLYDLHGLKLGVGIWEVQDHGCPPEKLERRNTIQLADKITVLARRMPMKDLLKSDLKTTIEHMQGAIGPVKSTPQMVHNLRNYTEYFKRPIHPLRLYQALRGNVELDTVSVHAPETALANHGWFFLLGTIALSKYKLVDLSKRQTPGAMDDLRLGATFLRHQLQFTPNNWEVWFRLAECFDFEVEDAVVWSADKMNKDRSELVKFQRNAIHCYTLALAKSAAAEPTSQDGDPLHDLYYSFAMRLYASSREPFAMEPFKHAEHERFFIHNSGMETFRRVLHEEMREFKVWKFAAVLFRRALRRKPQDWRSPFMISKCLWKMYQASPETLSLKDLDSKPSTDELIEALEHTIEVATAVPKSRHSDPILEPHYKILSIVHKLVVKGNLSQQEGADILSRQPFGIEHDPELSMKDMEDWEEYVIKSLRLLRDKDRQNWHHRMIARHARILFDDQADGDATYSSVHMHAQAAFGVLRESMFTKTMVMNVWKCDAERPGRHHVFTEQYVRFIVKILIVLKDRVSMEALLRRIRKKGGDFYHFGDLWNTCCQAYLQMLREWQKVPVATEDYFKAVVVEDFEVMADRLSKWVADHQDETPLLQAMKEAIELKKLNGGLMKAAMIDDLIVDCYTAIYSKVTATLPGLEASELEEARSREGEKEEKDEATKPALDELKTTDAGLAKPISGQESSLNADDGDKLTEIGPKRRIGVRRPDVLRKAEQMCIRSLEPQKPASGGPTTKVRVGSISSRKRGSRTPNEADDAGSDGDEDASGDDAVQIHPDEDAEMGEDSQIGDGGQGSPAGSSPRGSVHDSADDESDLSDVPEGWDDEPPPSLMFPNLKRSLGADAADSSSEDEPDDGADEEAEEEEADEEADDEPDEEAGEEADEDEGNESTMATDREENQDMADDEVE